MPQVPFFSSTFVFPTLCFVEYIYTYFIMHFNPRNVFVSGTVTANLFVSSYVGTISTLQLSKFSNGSYSLDTLSVNNVTTDNPSWLHKDPHNGILYCLNEGLSVVNGSISSFAVGDDGSLSLLGNELTINGPVSSVLFNGGKSLEHIIFKQMER